ncbi:hypothetical protein HKK52_04915 [Pseudomonas sp. ADAK2]|uniref:hypothetical protein n=1 Tax=unclassified Pseudomonas TaxID=196821 RepID=UPI001462B7A0|nr:MULTISPECIES: hypothetical protein [unclassified Pseudomonas]QJI40281.1 hypothetical protein HKK53_04910 [Pseudomonas sp. ADAK7]QJI46586.1 hypothetical protein HKK52_04915 [Pseudomonas sp. ADAK2]
MAQFLALKGRLPWLLNADSYALAVALLNQRSTHQGQFLKNLLEMETKYSAAHGEHINDAVVVNLSSPGLH